jgi:hypothetical protein
VRDRHPEGVDRLAGQCGRAIGDGDGNHDRQPPAEFLEHFLERDDARLDVERVDDRFEQQQIDPPSIRPRACSLKASRSWSKVMLRKAGLLTSGEIDRMRLVGPIEPATNRGRSGVRAVHSSAAARASFAPSTFIS